MNIEKFEKYYNEIKPLLRKDNEPHLFYHGHKTRLSFLLIHGFTACPWEMKELGEYLYSQGNNVYCMLVAGHGTNHKDLLNLKYQDWYKSVETAYELIKTAGEHTIVAGLSTGGLLSLKLASLNKNVSAVIAFSPGIFYHNWKIKLSGIAKYLYRYNIRPLEDNLKAYYYEKRAVSALHEVYKLSRDIKSNLDKINQPFLTIHSKKDNVVRYESSEYIIKNIASEEKRIILLEEGPHVLTTFENPDRNKLFADIYEWIKTLNML